MISRRKRNRNTVMLGLLLVLLLLTSLDAEVEAVGADSITDEQIKDYLTKYLDQCKHLALDVRCYDLF